MRRTRTALTPPWVRCFHVAVASCRGRQRTSNKRLPDPRHVDYRPARPGYRTAGRVAPADTHRPPAHTWSAHGQLISLGDGDLSPHHAPDPPARGRCDARLPGCSPARAPARPSTADATAPRRTATRRALAASPRQHQPSRAQRIACDGAGHGATRPSVGRRAASDARLQAVLHAAACSRRGNPRPARPIRLIGTSSPMAQASLTAVLLSKAAANFSCLAGCVSRLTSLSGPPLERAALALFTAFAASRLTIFLWLPRCAVSFARPPPYMLFVLVAVVWSIAYFPCLLAVWIANMLERVRRRSNQLLSEFLSVGEMCPLGVEMVSGRVSCVWCLGSGALVGAGRGRVSTRWSVDATAPFSLLRGNVCVLAWCRARSTPHRAIVDVGANTCYSRTRTLC